MSLLLATMEKMIGLGCQIIKHLELLLLLLLQYLQRPILFLLQKNLATDFWFSQDLFVAFVFFLSFKTSSYTSALPDSIKSFQDYICWEGSVKVKDTE